MDVASGPLTHLRLCSGARILGFTSVVLDGHTGLSVVYTTSLFPPARMKRPAQGSATPRSRGMPEPTDATLLEHEEEGEILQKTPIEIRYPLPPDGLSPPNDSVLLDCFCKSFRKLLDLVWT